MCPVERKAETALKALRPVREAAAAVAAAAKRTASVLVPNPGEVPRWQGRRSSTCHSFIRDCLILDYPVRNCGRPRVTRSFVTV